MNNVTWPDVAKYLIDRLPELLTSLGVFLTLLYSIKTRKTGKETNAVVVEVKKATEENRNQVETVIEVLAVNEVKVEHVKELVNSKMTEVQDKLEASLQNVSNITGEPKVSSADAPTTT